MINVLINGCNGKMGKWEKKLQNKLTKQVTYK